MSADILESGVPLECTVTGLVADGMASWDSELYDEEWADSEEPVHEQGGLLDVADGEARFTIMVPDHPPLLSLVTWVSQGEVDVYVFGTTTYSGLGGWRARRTQPPRARPWSASRRT
jgi:hypothetical protein